MSTTENATGQLKVELFPAAGEFNDANALPYNQNLLAYPVTGNGNLSIQTGGRTLYVYYSAQNPGDISMLYGTDFSRPTTPLNQGLSTFNPPYNLNLSYSVTPGTTGMFKLGWGF